MPTITKVRYTEKNSMLSIATIKVTKNFISRDLGRRNVYKTHQTPHKDKKV